MLPKKTQLRLIVFARCRHIISRYVIDLQKIKSVVRETSSFELGPQPPVAGLAPTNLPKRNVVE